MQSNKEYGFVAARLRDVGTDFSVGRLLRFGVREFAVDSGVMVLNMTDFNEATHLCKELTNSATRDITVRTFQKVLDPAVESIAVCYIPPVPRTHAEKQAAKILDDLKF